MPDHDAKSDKRLRDSLNFSVEGRCIGRGHPVFVIAEAGVNHNGDLEMARELVRQAKACGADAVKFQTFRARALVTRTAPKAEYQLAAGTGTTQLAMLERLELSHDAHRELQSLARAEGIVFLSTPYSPEDADFLATLGVPAVKIASAQMVEDAFLAHVAKKGVPMFVSTGMSDMREVVHAVDVIRQAGLAHFVMLQCTTSYPTRLDDANVLAVRTIARQCGVLVGYSDHTESTVAATAGVALGAAVLEKHFTLDRSLPGPDQAASFDPGQFRAYVKTIRETERALGTGEKQPTAIERTNIVPMRRGVVTLCDIRRGMVLTRDMLGLKRPAAGIAAARLEECIGRRAARDLPAETPLLDDSVEW